MDAHLTEWAFSTLIGAIAMNRRDDEMPDETMTYAANVELHNACTRVAEANKGEVVPHIVFSVVLRRSLEIAEGPLYEVPKDYRK